MVDKVYRRSQNTLEFSILIACCAAALIAMSGYIVRAMQGAYKEQSDELGMQYAPGQTKSDITENILRNSTIGYGMLNAASVRNEGVIPEEYIEEGRYYFFNVEEVHDEQSGKTVEEELDGF